jgi:hypothetical protein
MMRRNFLTAALFLVATACTGSPDNDAARPLPERVLLHYDFSGDWMATAGDQCSERLDLSENLFLSIGTTPDGVSDRFHIADFFMLEPGEPAEALVSSPYEDGKLGLAVETEGLVDGRRAKIIYAMLLVQEGALVLRLRAMTMTATDSRGQVAEVDLLAEAAGDPSIPVLGAAGSKGLCLKRLPR